MNIYRIIREEVDARLESLIQRAVVNLVNDKRMMQSLQLDVLADETEDDIEHFQPYGVSFNPPKDSEALAMSLGGDREGMVAILANKRSVRPQGAEEGEGGLYTLTGWKLFLDKDGNVFLTSKDGGNYKLARADRVEAELGKIKDHLGAQVGYMATAITVAPPAVAYAEVGEVGCDKAFGE